MTTTEWTAVPTALGDLRALIHVPDAPGPHPGVVLVDGSGDGACDDWGEWPDRLVGRGAVVLAHDKPGCGGSPGHWTSQSLTDRAHETLAAVRVLRAHPAVAYRPVGLFGMSQGGWVSLLAASLRTEPVDFIVSVSGPGVGPAAQDRVRLERELGALDTPPLALAEALDWIDERNRRLIAGEPPLDVLAAQQGYADRIWYGPVSQYFDSPVMFTFLAGLMSFDPVEVMPRVLCPVLALFGGSDTLVPVPASVTAFATHLPRLPGDPHGIAVFPGADHGLFTADPDPAVPRTDQLAVGFLPMVGDFLHRGVNARNSG